MKSNYRPPQLQNKEFFNWAREYICHKIDSNAGEAARNAESVDSETEVDVNDFYSYIIDSKGGRRFNRNNLKRWRKDASKAIRHAVQTLSNESLYIDRTGDKELLLKDGEPLVHYPDENQMNRSLYHKPVSPPPPPSSPPSEKEKMSTDQPQKKRRRLKPPQESPSSSGLASAFPCEIPSLHLGCVPFSDRQAINQLLMLAIGVQTQFQNRQSESSELVKAIGCLLVGPAGSGKSSLVRAVAGTLGMPLLAVSAFSFTGGAAATNLLTAIFDKVIEMAPSVLLISDIEALPVHLVGKAGSGNSSAGLRDAMVTALRRAANHVLVVGESTDSLARLNDSIKRLFPHNVTLGSMDLSARRSALRHLVATFKWKSRFSETLIEDLAMSTPGFEIEDLYRLLWQINLSAPLPDYLDLIFDTGGNVRVKPGEVSRESLLACHSRANVSQARVIDEALAKVVPLARQKPGFVSVPSVTWADVGALEGPKRELERFLTMVREPELAAKLWRDAESLLLVGPPGCGKTMLAKALSNEAGLNFISVKGPEVLNKYQGESERQVRELFERARACPPCLIFFDELDAICARRGEDSSSGHTSVVLQLLTEMDGLSPRGRVFVMGATNRLDIIDEAFLRRGRMGRVVHVGPPVSAEERISVLRALTRNGTRPRLEGDVDEAFREVAEDERVTGFSGAQLRGVLDEAKFSAQLAKRDSLTLSDLEFGINEMSK